MKIKDRIIKVAIASDFLTAFSKIPRNQQGKVLDFINKFRSDPTASSINYEKIQHAKDSNIHSVRIDKAYRGIVMKPETGNVYVLLWVDHHDKAYQWAKNKVCSINPETGSLQIYKVADSEVQLESKSESWDQEVKTLFSDIRDKHLMRLGVPEMLLPLVRSLKTEEELNKAADILPQEAYESLFFLISGFPLEEVFQEMEKLEELQEVNTDDYEKALDNPESQHQFMVVDDELELKAILAAPLEKWRVFLHPSQRKLVEKEWNGPVRVLGGAGTGKTVVAMHRAKWLALNICKSKNDRILFTTFTRNLAEDIKENLGKICTDDIMSRIEVVNLDRWVSNFMRSNGYKYEIDYGKRTEELWENALNEIPANLNLAPSFYREEWERIIQPHGIVSLAEYMKVSRIGRGIRLNRKDRKSIWPVFEEYRVLLNERGLREADDAMRDARAILEGKGNILPYQAIVVDEAQDMGPQAFQLIKQMVSEKKEQNSIFIVGDAHQRIYRHKVVLSNCNINIRGRGRKLRINYRTTEETSRWSVNLLKGVNIDDLDGGKDDLKGYKSLLHGNEPEIKRFETFKNEVDFIAKKLQQLESEGGNLKEICLVARTNDLLKQYEGAIKAKGLETYFIRRSEAENRMSSGLRMATMHRVKGLEFDQIIIVGLNKGIVPFEKTMSGSSDLAVQRESELRERALLYVAATRAKKEVIITCSGTVSEFLKT